MAIVQVSPFKYVSNTISMLRNGGLLLVSGNEKEANVMTIGWGLPGPLWEKPFFIIAVRPSRYTFKFIEETNNFTINVPGKGMEKVLSYCGSVSGRSHDKFKDKKLTRIQSQYVTSPNIEQCLLHYECQVYYKTVIRPEILSKGIRESCYPEDDYHTLYFGEILGTFTNQ